VAVALRRFKYEDRPDLAAALGSLAQRALREQRPGAKFDLVVPVPLHPRRLVERGYNQAALLAHHVADVVSAPIEARALVRRKNTPQQARLDREARLRNVGGAFTVRDSLIVRGRAVLLVDDVATSGATLAACTTPLLQAGAARVDAVVIARADRASSLTEEPW
jgi:ComF family protein